MVAVVGKNRQGSQYDFDLIVIGSGAGGGVTAHIAASKHKSVAIVEDDSIGGECPNWGCVPTKAYITAADTYDVAKSADQFGIRATSVTYNYQAIRKWKDLAVQRTGVKDGGKAYKADGIKVINGRAHFIGPHEVSVEGKRYSAKKFMVATGTKNFIPPIEGLHEAGYMTYRDCLVAPKPPKSMLIIGGGPIGCEFAHIFSSFGTKVTLVEYAPRLIANEDSEVGEMIQQIFEDKGVDVFVGAEVFKVEEDRSKKIVHFRQTGREMSTRVDKILVTTGKVANTDLGLENAGVQYDKRHIITDTTMQTTAPHIYAAGDVAGPFAFTHMASYQSRIAAHNMFSRKKVYASYHAVPRCVFTWPEVAAVGMSEKEAHKMKVNFKTAIVPISIIGRSNTSNFHEGFVKVIVESKTRTILGASAVCPRAGEVIHELTLATNMRLRAEDVANTIHAFPTWSEAVRIACQKLV